MNGIVSMPKTMQIPPTRSNLLQLREQLQQARAGHALLEHKREVLAHELLIMIQDAESTEAEARVRFKAAYDSLLQVRMRMGGDRLRWASLAQAAEIQTSVGLHSIMGVAVPLVQVDVTPLPLPYGLGDTSVSLDDARTRWLAVAGLIGHLAETATTVWRLAAELQKTQRRVNALEDVLIPQYEATIHAIAETLEEHEREAFVHSKRTKARKTGDGED
jgi:V/A-type H+-transporting ATPase subunit D